MNKLQLSRAQLEACKLHGITSYPELGVLSKLLLGVYKVPSKPIEQIETVYISFNLGELVYSIDEACKRFKEELTCSLSSTVLNNLISIDLEKDSDGDITIKYATGAKQGDLDNYEAEMLIHKNMLALLSSVKITTKDYAYMDEEDRKAAIQNKIKELQKML